MYEEQLKEIGLTDNEGRIYLLLLQQGMMNPSEIAEKLGIHRGYIYDALERMREKQLVSSILKNNKKQFQAASPERITELLALKLENFQRIAPALQKLASLEKEETTVELHKGARAYRTLIKDIIATVKKNAELFLIGIDEDLLLSEVEPIYLRQYFRIIKEKNIREKIIIAKGKKKVKSMHLAYKELPQESIGKTMQVLYNNKTALFIPGTPHYLIIIDNKELAETFRKQFLLLWNI